jgi:hypothetical protein
MIDQVLFDWAPLTITTVVGFFLADYVLTHLGARAAQRVRDRWSVEGSYEMNPTWEGQIDSGRWFSWRVPAVAGLLAILLAAVRLLVDPGLVGLVVGLDLGLDPAFFGFAAGLMLLLQAAVLMAHAANLQTFRDMAVPSAVEGGMRFSRWYAYRGTAGYVLRFGILWLLLWVPSQQAFFLGGAVSCLLWTRRMAQLASAARTAQASGHASEPATEPSSEPSGEPNPPLTVS